MVEIQVTEATHVAFAAADRSSSAVSSSRNSGLNRRTLLQGIAGSVAILVGTLGAGGVLIQDPVLGNGPFSWLRYGHGQQLAKAVLYLGVCLLVWAWVRLGRDVLAERVRARGVLLAGISWIAPMVVSPPSFTRDVFSYLAQGELAWRHLDPYSVGPNVLDDVISQNVHPFWQSTPAPYGPLFILVAKLIAGLVGQHLIYGVILMRLTLMIGLGLVIWSLPGLVRHLGGRLSMALWIAVANPIVVIHLVGGPHNDLLMIGCLAMGTLLVLDRKHVAGIALVTLGMAVKATAAIALPFLVWVWAGRLSGSRSRRLVRAGAASLGVFVVVFGATMLVSWQNLGWIGALNAPTMIINWVNLPTGLGELLAGVVGIFGDLSQDPFINMTRTVGDLVLAVLAVVQWWRSRDGGADAVRRAGLVLLAVAILAPPTLPWYLTWGVTILCAAPWRRRWLAFMVGVTVLVTLVYYPNGEAAMFDFAHMAWVAVVAVLAMVSLLRPDPLKLRKKRPGQVTDEPGVRPDLRDLDAESISLRPPTDQEVEPV